MDGDGDVKPMGDNPANPQAENASDVPTEGLKPEGADPSDHPNPGNETNDALLGDKSHLEAQAHLDAQRIALLEKDNEGLKKQVEDARTKRAGWQDAFGLRDGDDPKDKVWDTIAKSQDLAKRVQAVQVALGIGDDGDPSAAVAALRTPGKSKGAASQLPPWGLLLLLTHLAKHDPYIGAGYRMTPDVLDAPNGDRWMALRQEALNEDAGTMGHVVTVQRLPSTYAYESARSRKIKLDGDLALALRQKVTAEKASAVRNLTAESVKTAKGRLDDATTRVDEIQKEIDSLTDSLVPPVATEWRVTCDLAGYDGKVGT